MRRRGPTHAFTVTVMLIVERTLVLVCGTKCLPFVAPGPLAAGRGGPFPNLRRSDRDDFVERQTANAEIARFGQKVYPKHWRYDRISHLCLWARQHIVVDLREWNYSTAAYCVLRSIARNTDDALLRDLIRPQRATVQRRILDLTFDRQYQREADGLRAWWMPGVGPTLTTHTGPERLRVHLSQRAQRAPTGGRRRARPVDKYRVLLAHLPPAERMSLHGNIDSKGFMALPESAEALRTPCRPPWRPGDRGPRSSTSWCV